MEPAGPRAVIFDVDGTLAETERDGHRVAFNLAFRELGLDCEWDVPLYGELLAVTGGKERLLRFFQERRPDLLDRPDVAELVRALHHAKNLHYAALLAAGAVRARPGVVRLVRELRAARARLAIATTTSPENVHALLATALRDVPPASFEVIGAGDVVPAKKPSPDLYGWVLDRLGLPASACVAIEDSRSGVRAARGAGLTVLAVPSEYSAGEDLSGSVAVLSDLGEPDAPFTVLAGDAHGHRWVVPELLARWVSAGARAGRR
jgi:HAD superfamily hydrolase (TIGR01509 family)